MSDWKHEPWEHPDWYDLHDTNWTAGSEREPEHYTECVLALPPLGVTDHVFDVGSGTGKLVLKVARAYPDVTRFTLIEPNTDKLSRACRRVRSLREGAECRVIGAALGRDHELPQGEASVILLGSVLMPTLELAGGTLGEGLGWLRAALGDLRQMLAPHGLVFDVETLAAPWARGGLEAPVRRLHMSELTREFSEAGFADVECLYRFRDRVILRGARPAE